MVEKEYKQWQSETETSLLKYILKENALYRLNYVLWIQISRKEKVDREATL